MKDLEGKVKKREKVGIFLFSLKTEFDSECYDVLSK